MPPRWGALFVLFAIGCGSPAAEIGVMPAEAPRGGANEAPLALDLTDTETIIALHEHLEAISARDPESLSHAERTILVIERLETELNAEGLVGYYSTARGDDVREAVVALREIGAMRMAGIIEGANAWFGPDGPSSDVDIREDRLLAEPTDALQVATDAFLEYPDPLAELLTAYAAAHSDEIRRPARSLR